MLLPISDSPRPPGIPWVTYGLIAANLAIYLLISLPASQQAGGSGGLGMDDSLFRTGEGTLYTLLVSLFTHASLMHVLGNMLMLHIFGDNVELHVGRLPFALIYLGTGVASTCIFALFSAPGVTLVGASGAVSGILGCYLVWFPHHQVRVIWGFFFSTFEVSARYVLWAYLLVDNVLPSLMGSAGDQVAHGAHIGGFLAGAGIALGWKRGPQVGRAASAPARPFARPANPAPQAAALAELEQRIANKAYAAAAGLYAELPPHVAAGLAAGPVIELADWLTEQQRTQEALLVLRQFIGLRQPIAPSAVDTYRLHLAQIHLRAGFLQLRALGRKDAAQLHFFAVLQLAPPWQIRQAAEQALVDCSPQK